ncbi:MAG: SulP family inorganic anion transporter, partial [Cyanobacteria bacterium P01_H01_bin.121]
MIRSALKHWHQFSGSAKATATNLAISAVLGIYHASWILAVVSLLFTGDLAPEFGSGLTLAVFSTVFVGIGLAIGSSVPGMVGGINDNTLALGVLLVDAILTGMPAEATSSAILATTLAAFSTATFLTGLIFWLIGQFRLGYLVRFVPYPVIGGFLAGTGWLLAQGGMQMLTTVPLQEVSLVELFRQDVLMQWLAGITFAIVLQWLSTRTQNPLVFPGAVLGAIALFYLGLWITQTPVEIALEHGWLLGSFGDQHVQW